MKTGMVTGLCAAWLMSVGATIAAEDLSAELVSRAVDRFQELSESETRLCRGVALGEVVDLRETTAEGEPGEVAIQPIRARLLAWLCGDSAIAPRVTRRGISLRHAVVDGLLDLRYARVDFPITLRSCEIADGVDLDHAEIYELHLDGSRLGRFDGDQLRVSRDLTLGEDFTCLGELRLSFAWIEGHLELGGAHLENRQPDALFADGCRVDGDLRLRYLFIAQQRVSLNGVRVKGDLDCDESEFRNATGVALELQGANIGGNWTLRMAQLFGGVICHGVSVGGDVNADGAVFEAREGTAIRGYGLKAGGDARFVGAKIHGDVVLESANIGRDLNFADARFDSTDRPIDLNLHGLSANRRFRWTTIHRQGEHPLSLDLRSATVRTLFDEADSWPESGSLRMNGFRYVEIHDDAPLDASSRKIWLRLQPRTSFRGQPYEQLAEVYRHSGQASAAREILVAKESDRAERTRLTASEWFWYRIFGPMIGYGYEPWRALELMAIEVLIGASIFQFGYWRGWMAPSKVLEHVFESTDAQTCVVSRDYPKFNSLVYSIDVFAPLTYLGQADYWMPNPHSGTEWNLGVGRMRAGDVLRIYMWLHVVAGWTLTSLLLAGLSGLVQQSG